MKILNVEWKLSNFFSGSVKYDQHSDFWSPVISIKTKMFFHFYKLKDVQTLNRELNQMLVFSDLQKTKKRRRFSQLTYLITRWFGYKSNRNWIRSCELGQSVQENHFPWGIFLLPFCATLPAFLVALIEALVTFDPVVTFFAAAGLVGFCIGFFLVDFWKMRK